MNFSRREFLRTVALGSAAVAAGALVGCVGGRGSRRGGPTQLVYSLDTDWLFGGKLREGAARPEFDDSGFEKIVLPHAVAKLSWQDWEPAQWEAEWIYRRHFSVPASFQGRRVFLNFAGVMVGASPVINGRALPKHVGGYLPFQYEVTDLLVPGENVLAVAVDARWGNVPPEGSAKGAPAVDFSEVGGIHRRVSLRAVPPIFISDVFAKPVKVLEAGRRVEVSGTVDAALVPSGRTWVRVEMRAGVRCVAEASVEVSIDKAGLVPWELTLDKLGDLKLWDLDSPQLYDVVSTLYLDEKPWHDHRTRIGLRDARFELDGFYLNDRRVQLFGLCRHEIYPYVGFAMPDRVMRRDAEILKHELNCNAVRCSHYPQTEAFLDACDELGLLVWEEIPGWGYLGDAAWQDLAVRDVSDLVVRDRNHPSIFIWGVRVNESKNNPALYERTTAAMKALDDSRPSSGAMVGGLHSTKNWAEDVFAYNDYHHDAKTGVMTLEKPLPGVPYLLTEAVGQVVGVGGSTGHIYRRTGDPFLQQKQAIYHAEAHDQAAADTRFAGVIAWCGFDYASPVNVAWHGVKYPGVADVFRIPKLGAAVYRAQVAPQVRAVIEPNFYWDFGSRSPRGPGNAVAIFSNCERLELFVDGQPHATLFPERAKFPHLPYASFFADLEMDGTKLPELRVDGYVGETLALSRSFSADPARDQWVMAADDAELVGDGVDATRVVVRVVDKFGAPRPFATGGIAFELSGPGLLVGDNPFLLGDAGGAGAVWVKTLPESSGRIVLKARHSSFGDKTVKIKVRESTDGIL